MNVNLIRIPKGKKEYNGMVERSHRTDDEEFYIPFAKKANNQTQFLKLANNWKNFYNYKRVHYGKGMNKTSPATYLKESKLLINPAVPSIPVILLDDCKSSVATKLLVHYS